MAAFAKQVMDATKETDPELIQKQQDEYNRQVQQMQRQFGTQQQAGTPILGIGSAGGMSAATTQAKIDDATRRQTATGKAMDYAGTVDTRKTGIAAQIDAAIRRRQLGEQKYSDTQGQQDRTNALQLQELAQGTKEATDKMAFTNYKSDAERRAAMQAAYKAGNLDKQLNDAALQGALTQADLDAYFDMEQQDLMNKFKATTSWNQMAAEEWVTDANTKAANYARIIQGAGTIISSTENYAYRKSSTTGGY